MVDKLPATALVPNCGCNIGDGSVPGYAPCTGAVPALAETPMVLLPDGEMYGGRLAFASVRVDGTPPPAAPILVDLR